MVIKLIVVDQTMSAGATWFNEIIMFLLLLANYCVGTVDCLGFGWGGPVALARSELWRVCPHICLEKVLTSSSIVI